MNKELTKYSELKRVDYYGSPGEDLSRVEYDDGELILSTSTVGQEPLPISVDLSVKRLWDPSLGIPNTFGSRWQGEPSVLIRCQYGNRDGADHDFLFTMTTSHVHFNAHCNDLRLWAWNFGAQTPTNYTAPVNQPTAEIHATASAYGGDTKTRLRREFFRLPIAELTNVAVQCDQ